MVASDESRRPVRRSFWQRQRSSTWLTLILLGWLLLELFVLPRRVVPPDWVQTFDDFLQWHPDPRQIVIFRRDENLLLAATGKSTSLVLASGPSMYVFDRSGRMIEWTPDCGDDHRFSQGSGWHESIVERMTLNEARIRLQRGAFTQTVPAP